MNLDNKKPGRKPLYVYYIIAAIIIILLNVLLLPAIEGRKVQTTDYIHILPVNSQSPILYQSPIYI